MPDTKDHVAVQASPADPNKASSSQCLPAPGSSQANIVDGNNGDVSEAPADAIDTSKKGFFAYFRTKEFYITLVLGLVILLSSV